MDYDIYTVELGDTLGKIAKQHNTDVDELAGINRIADPNLIYVGQQIRIPRDSYTQDDDFYNEQWICFVDPIGQPICNLKTRVVTAERDYYFTTDDKGFIPPIRTRDRDDKPQVFVNKLEGGEKKVATLSAPPGVHQQTLRSPRQKIEMPLRRHDGTPDHDPAQPIKLAPGQVQHNRDLAGNPVINVGVECPNKENLRLGTNNKYRAYVIASANRCGLLPQGIAAFANAEALTKKTTKTIQQKDKHGAVKNKTVHVDTGEWDPTSKAPGSSGLGLTQFLSNSWLAIAKDKSSLLHQKLSEAESGGKKMSSSELLNLRLDPELSLVSAGDYAKMNLIAIEKLGVTTKRLRDTEQAKVAYFCHHEGAGGAAALINGTLTDVSAENKLAKQLKKTGSTGVPEADAYMKIIGLRGLAAYKKWLFDYIDLKITPLYFACNPTKLEAPRSMNEIAASMLKNKEDD